MDFMSETNEPLTRAALDTLATVSVEELRRLAQQLDGEAKIVKALLRERTRRPDREALRIAGID
jgi:hypothetical protein